ncbi:PP2C family serine/threonine-protein phosphatase [Sporobolomyces koalae]|uniref:PP2C family serine/threonine-protein phosphatase n=1 Tax=Sporobolomyces koalae TaxID=500713 RepID=UPI0031764BA9
MSKSPKALLPSSLSFSQISRAAVQSATVASSSSHRVRRYVATTAAGGQCLVVRSKRVPSSARPSAGQAPANSPSTSSSSTAPAARTPDSSLALRSGLSSYSAAPRPSTARRVHFSTSCAHPRHAPNPISSPASGLPTSSSSASNSSSSSSSSPSSAGPSKHHSSLSTAPFSANDSAHDATDVLLSTPTLGSHSQISTSTPTASSPSSSSTAPGASSNGPSPGSLFAGSSSSRIPAHALPSFFGSSSLQTPFRGNLVFRNGAYGIPKNTNQHTRSNGKGKDKLVEHPATGGSSRGEELDEHALSVSVGEDAYFLRSDSLGVADGVGGWSGHAGANPARWARKFMHHCSSELARYENIDDEMFLQYYQVDPVEVMQRAFETCLRESKDEGIIGSSTALLAVLRNDELHLANLGDCYCCVIRDNDYIFRSEEQQHSFNFPFQAGTNSKDTPGKDAQRFMVKVQKDDIVLLASDGLVDNVFSDDLLEEILRFVSVTPAPTPATKVSDSTGGGPKYTLNKFSPQLVSESLCYRAKSVYDDPRAVASPFQNRAVEEGLYYAGGKKDDVTCLIGVVGELEASPNRRDVQ